METNASAIAELRPLIDRRQLVVVVGSGVSMTTNPQSPTWRSLIESGVQQCRAIGASDTWCGNVAGLLEAEDEPDMLLSAAELVHQKLRADGGGELARWLRDVFQPLLPESPAVIQALAALDLPLVTTNYDGLIEQVTQQRPVCWTDPSTVSSVVYGDDRRVLHLHGHWEEPKSVVLGIRSYEAVRNNEHTQAVLQALGMTSSFLFVGCGEEGLADPNWGSFLSWLESIETGAGVKHRHYRLVREADKFAPRGRLFPMVYGENYEDLAPFLRQLLPEIPAENNAASTPMTVTIRDARPDNVMYYLRCLEEETACLTLLGMGRNLQVELPIADAYVPLRTTMARSMDKRETERFKLGHAEHEEEVDLGEVFRKAAQFGQHGVVLLGEPGSGKTTGARQLAWRLASHASRPEDLGLPVGMTPVFLRFRNLSRTVLKQKNGLRTFLEEETRCDDAPDGMQSPGTDLWNGVGGGLLWILDGLDEVVDAESRRKVSGWIRSAIKKRPDDRFLVTCRFAGYFREGVPLGPKFVEFHVRPLDDEQMAEFVHDWFAAAYGKLLGSGPRATARAQADSDELLTILARPTHQGGHIRELCTNPLLLTILCIVFHEERKLPTGRAELYAHCVRVLLEYWRRDLYESDLGTTLQAYDAEAAQAVLARLAWWLHQEQDRTSAPLEELAAEAAQGLAQVSPDSGLGRDGGRFLERMRDEAGILAMEGAGCCGFLHLSFQEYLAAEHAAREGLAQELASVASESWWRESALLSLRRSRPFCEAFFREMLAAGIAEQHPDLAERCLSEALYFVPDPFVELLERPRPKATKARPVHDARVAAVLRLLRDRVEQVPDLDDICRLLAESTDQETSGFAREILIRRGVDIAPEAGAEAEFVDQKTGISFVAIPAGEFQMGSEKGDSDEKPIHLVRITNDFWLGKYPVTNAQYSRYMEAVGKGVKKPEYWDDRRFNQPEQALVGVSWDEAQAFCEWAGGRLPTEAEWEYCCRAGTSTEFSFGDDEKQLGDYALFAGNSNGQTQPVGAKRPNEWGLYDMHGNVWEWCQDWFDTSYYKNSPTSDPMGPATGSHRVIRGGGWIYNARSARSAFRSGSSPGHRYNYLGFRCLSSGNEPRTGQVRSPGAEAERPSPAEREQRGRSSRSGRGGADE